MIPNGAESSVWESEPNVDRTEAVLAEVPGHVAFLHGCKGELRSFVCHQLPGSGKSQAPHRKDLGWRWGTQK